MTAARPTVENFLVERPKRGSIYLDRASFMILNDDDVSTPDAVVLDWNEPSGRVSYRVIPTNEDAIRIITASRIRSPLNSPSVENETPEPR